MCPSSRLWGGVLDCDSQFTILSLPLFDRSQFWRSTSVCFSLYLFTLAYCVYNRKVISLWVLKSSSIGIIRVTQRDCDGREKTIFIKQRVSHSSVHVWGVNSTVTKYSDYSFERTRQSSWPDAVTTAVDKKQVNSCLLKKQLFEGVQQQKLPKFVGNAFSDALIILCFERGKDRKRERERIRGTEGGRERESEK